MLKNYFIIAFRNLKRHKLFSFINVLCLSVRLVILAIVIASPLGWWMMNNWLKEFAYHIDISWWMFALAASIAIAIAILTVSFGAIKAAIANPVKSLRTE